MLTYAAGLQAVTIVWIAETFREEHRAALDWLNESTPDQINFFGLEIKLFRIADSPVAPQFSITCKPNQWTRAVADAARPASEQSQFRWAYWSGFVQQPALREIVQGVLQPNRQGNLPIPTAWQQFRLQVYISTTGESGVYLSCRGLDRFRHHEVLERQRAAIETTIGSPLAWRTNRAQNGAWVTLTVHDLDPTRRDDWPRQQQILATKTVEFYRTLDPYVRPLDEPQTT